MQPRLAHIIFFAPYFWVGLLFAQTVSENPLGEAETLLNGGKTAQAVVTLEQYLRLHPHDALGHWILGRALYWSGKPEAARLSYRRAIDSDPANAWIRVEFGRMLAETGDMDRAREVVAPARLQAEAGPDAGTLLGIISYWEGDWTTASEHFRSALRQNSLHPEAQRLLSEIRSATAPTVVAKGGVESDTQPLHRTGVTVQGSWNSTPLQVLLGSVRLQNVTVDDSLRRVLAFEVGGKQFFPSTSFELDAAVGLVDRSYTGDADITWRLGFGVRFPHHWTLGIRGERAPYLQTSPSLSTSLSTMTLGADIAWSPTDGPRGKAGLDMMRFPDANTLTQAYLWFLLPVSRSNHAEYSLGYGGNYQNTTENRFQIDTTSADLSGTYVPYYTPLNLQSHSILAVAIWNPAPSLKLRISGAFGIVATEDNPSFTGTTDASTSPPRPGRPSTTTELEPQRSFRPWNVEAVVEGPLGPALRWSLEGRFASTSYYDVRRAALRLSYRFLPSDIPMNPADR